MKLLIFGPQASGKGTQASKIAQHYNISHISTGNIFRANISQGTELGILAEKLMNKGILVPDDLTNNLIKNRLAENDCKDGFILDGYPRTKNQTEFLDTLQYNFDAAINLKIPKEEIIKRISNRRVCVDCKENFNLIYKQPKEKGSCDKCGGKLVQREDDQPEAIKKRLETYHNQTEPLLGFYKEKGILININGEQPINDVFEEIIEKLSAL